MRLIGITMRELAHTPAPAVSANMHDALSHDWGRFCAAAGIAWIPLPNRGEETLALVTHLNLAGIILTGGGDVGAQPCRDSTEALLLAWAQHTGTPLLGVCRGFQFIQRAFGGALVPCDSQRHVALRHELTWVNTLPGMQLPAAMRVNSYHNWGIQQLAAPLIPLAVCAEDNTIEAAMYGTVHGIMWHPEREKIPSLQACALVHRTFYGI